MNGESIPSPFFGAWGYFFSNNYRIRQISTVRLCIIGIANRKIYSFWIYISGLVDIR